MEIAALISGRTTANTRLAKDGDKVIAVLQRGWVVAGTYAQAGDIATVSSAHVVRRWGTTKGLGELAAQGPLASTVLDPCPPASFHVREAVMVLECGDVWR